MTCSVVRDMLGAYFDGELDANAELQIRLHLSECADCAAELERLERQRQLIRGGGLSYHAPAALESRIRKSLRSDHRSSIGWRTWVALAAAVLLVSTLSIRLVQLRGGTANQIAEQAVSSHVRAMMTGHTADIASTDGHTVKPWFNGRIDFSPPVIDLASQGFRLIGGRVDYLAHRSVAALVYQRRKHIIDLFIWPATTDDTNGIQSSNGYNIVRWTKGGMSFVAVSDLNNIELEQFRDLLLK
ncbi:MAG: anti-sigma factor family protein [Bryobacteraceae bacterium]